MTFNNGTKRVIFYEMFGEQNTYSRVFQINPLEYTSFEQQTLLLYIYNSEIDFILSVINVDMTIMSRTILQYYYKIYPFSYPTHT